MNIEQFDFLLPQDRIAQHPLEKRDHSRLLMVNKATQTLQDAMFYDILDQLSDKDCLIINETKVLPARLLGTKKETDAAIELLLLKDLGDDTWECLAKPGKRVKLGTKVYFADRLVAECTGVFEEGIRHMKMKYQGIFIEVLESLGTMPLPPYIKERLHDQSRYQTVYAKDLGSAAAPTAGLHFTPDLLKKIEQKGVMTIPITLHVGLGTFRPVQVSKIEDHHMHEETYTITPESYAKLMQAKKQNKRFICVGTTSLRALESNFDGAFHEGTFQTHIFIYPGYSFKAVDALITNFHLPKSTLFMLVSAFSSTELMKKAYQHAIDLMTYRFFSFGDAMFIY